MTLARGRCRAGVELEGLGAAQLLLRVVEGELPLSHGWRLVVGGRRPHKAVLPGGLVRRRHGLLSMPQRTWGGRRLRRELPQARAVGGREHRRRVGTVPGSVPRHPCKLHAPLSLLVRRRGGHRIAAREAREARRRRLRRGGILRRCVADGATLNGGALRISHRRCRLPHHCPSKGGPTASACAMGRSDKRARQPRWQRARHA
mmetsp:Transcript_58140/g.189432  ORF Transcript_58140/g.189432 Transcript_58140/m.189432 type:complete len:203 (+) Transcript_58140:134-742(+)